MAKDGKMYLTDVIDDDGVNTLIAVIPSKKTAVNYTIKCNTFKKLSPR